MNKTTWLDWAETFDSWRVVPRLFLFGYWITTFSMIFWIFNWYMHLDLNGRGNQESGLIGVTVGIVIKFGMDVFNTYVSKGRDWTAGSAGAGQTTTLQVTPTAASATVSAAKPTVP